MQLETKRLRIREFVQEDRDAVHVYASDPAVAKYMTWGPNTDKETSDYIALMLQWQREEPRMHYELAVELKENGLLIGGCGINLSDPRQAEIGYCFNKQYWRQGFAAEAAGALLAFGFGEAGLHRIYATCRPENAGSAGVMQKLGMSREGLLREHMWHKGAWHSSYLYSILKDEYMDLHC